MSVALNRHMTQVASTKRPPAISQSKRGAPVTYLTGVRHTPLEPGDPGQNADIRATIGTETPYMIWRTFSYDTYDIVAGDVLVTGGKEYPVITGVAWPRALHEDAGILELYLQQFLRAD